MTNNKKAEKKVDKKAEKKAPAKKVRAYRNVRLPLRQDAFTKFAEMVASQDETLTHALAEMVDAQLSKSLGMDGPITRPLIIEKERAERAARKEAKK